MASTKQAWINLVSNAPACPVIIGLLAHAEQGCSDKEIVYNVLLIMSGILLEENGKQVAVENAPSIINQLIELTAYSHMMAIRESALQCLAVSELPHTRIYPLRSKEVVQSPNAESLITGVIKFFCKSMLCLVMFHI